MQTYERDKSAVFCKTREQYGGYSNMAAGFPLVVNGVAIRTSEALYQALRFPAHPEVQREVIEKKSPMAAKMVAKHHAALTRPDWEVIRVPVMWFALRVKLAQHWRSFGALLQSSGGLPIVELSHKDTFWGAVVQPDGTLVGENVLGRLLDKLRAVSMDESTSHIVVPLPEGVRDLLLLGVQIEPVHASVG